MVIKDSNTALCEVAGRFCRSRLGRCLGRRSQAAQKLAFTLLGNPYWNTSGSYRLSLDVLAAQMVLPVSEILPLLNLLQACGFCTYAPGSARIYIPLLEALYQRLLPQKSPISVDTSAHMPASHLQEQQ